MPNKQLSLLSEEKVNKKSKKKSTKDTVEKEVSTVKATDKKKTAKKVTTKKTSKKQTVKKARKNKEPITLINLSDVSVKFNNYENLMGDKHFISENDLSVIKNHTPSNKVDTYMNLIFDGLNMLDFVQGKVVTRVALLNKKQYEEIRLPVHLLADFKNADKLILAYIGNKLEGAPLSLINNLNAFRPEQNKVDKYLNRVKKKISTDAERLTVNKTPTTTFTELTSILDVYPSLSIILQDVLSDIQSLARNIIILKIRPLGINNNKSHINNFLTYVNDFVYKCNKFMYED